jgi:hypothetical protein
VEKSTPTFCATAHSSRRILSCFGLRTVKAAIRQHQKEITAFERFGIRECTGHQSSGGKVYWNDIPISIFCMRNIESPKNAGNVDKQAPLRDMQSRTDPPSSAESEMISFKDVGMSGVLCSVQREIQKAVGKELINKA